MERTGRAGKKDARVAMAQEAGLIRGCPSCCGCKTKYIKARRTYLCGQDACTTLSQPKVQPRLNHGDKYTRQVQSGIMEALNAFQGLRVAKLVDLVLLCRQTPACAPECVRGRSNTAGTKPNRGRKGAVEKEKQKELSENKPHKKFWARQPQ